AVSQHKSDRFGIEADVVFRERLADPSAHEVRVLDAAYEVWTAAKEGGKVGQRARERQGDVVAFSQRTFQEVDGVVKCRVRGGQRRPAVHEELSVKAFLTPLAVSRGDRNVVAT